MITNWIGRVFGRSSSTRSATPMLPSLLLTDTAPPATSIVDSDELAAELARARRYEHDLSIVVLSARPYTHGSRASDHNWTPESRLPQMVALLAAVALREVLRRSDVVCYQPSENRFVLALAESDGDDAEQALNRIRNHFRTRLRLRVRAGIAHFSQDALTLDELIGIAAERAAQTGEAQPAERVGGGRLGGAFTSPSIGPVEAGDGDRDSA